MASLARSAVLEHLHPDMDEDIIEYLASLLETLLGDEDAEKESVKSEFHDAVISFVEGLENMTEDDAESFCDKVLKTVFGQGGATPKGDVSAKTESLPADSGCICNVTNMLLMYGGSPSPLLKNATLHLLHGRRYGVIGSNGTGKTSLMRKIGSKDILGFPSELRVAHLRHEDILRAPSLTARDYARKQSSDDQMKHNGIRTSTAAADEDMRLALKDVGFDDDMLSKTVGALSGGWQMRLALACAIVQKAKLLLLDEPTNHLDTAAVDWLVAWVNRTCAGGDDGATAVIVSHDPAFLNRVCTDIIHFTKDAKLNYHHGDFDTFKNTVLGGDEAKAQALLEVDTHKSSEGSSVGGYPALPTLSAPTADRLVFPAPDKLAGEKKDNPVVLSLTNVCFQHDKADTKVLSGVNLELKLSSRIAIVGKNGSGKSTLLALLAGRLQPQSGEFWSHEKLRFAYVAQHTESQLADFLSCKPHEYIQLRFKRGYDTEMPRRPGYVLSMKEARRTKEVARMHGKKGKEVETILSRQINNASNGDVQYEVKWKDLGYADNTFEKPERLKKLNVGYMVDEFNEMMLDAWGSAPERPITDREICRHLEDFGLSEDAAQRSSISMLSSGQKGKLMLAASFWTKPHIVFFDEPTNALDVETVQALSQALIKFKGGYAVVSHNQEFVDKICEEIWDVADGQVVVRPAVK